MFGRHTGEMPRPKLKTPGLLIELVSTLVFIVAVTVLFDLAIPRSLVDGHSMEPTFYGNDRLVVSRAHYLLGSPQRRDILVFNSVNPSERERGVMLIKRVIGLPGETVEIRDRKVHINGEALNEPYIKDEVCRRRCQDRIWELEENEYFMMGDNRNNSNDSRAFRRPVTLPDIVGRVIIRYFPPQSIGIIPS
ncbi:MAG: signal peptidase I [Chloroflexota bacterium]|nr:signal peptidase I [Chloroflexota bacterium]MDE2909980.1 signal peptidase I [Chloroflexota bacterium]